jgi:hypothetical protein
MIKHIAIATVLTCGALGAYAQTAPNQAATPPAGAATV